MSNRTLIVGAGPMAIEYSKVLSHLKRDHFAVGRGEKSVRAFEEATGQKAISGGIESWLASAIEIPEQAIVAVSEELLGSTTMSLLEKGVRSILVEKPGGFLGSEIEAIAKRANELSAKVFVGYNRRFYSSVLKAKQLISQEGGAKSFQFEFTEWGHVIEKKVCPPEVKEEWLMHNSTHVMDLAFFLGGFPSQLTSFVSGSLHWHAKGAVYAGAGVAQQGALFSYSANWAAPGRWVVEVLTNQSRYIFKPLEKLQVQKIGSVAVEEIPLEDELDKQFKPGLYRQTDSFLGGGDNLITIQTQAQNMKWFDLIGKGGRS